MKIFHNNQGSAVTITIFLLFGLTALAFVGVSIATSGLEAYRAQGSSAKAYYAAETGIERALMIFKLKPEQLFNQCVDNQYIKFDGDSLDASNCTDFIDDDNVKCNVGNDIENADYWVKISFENSPYDSSNKKRQVVLTALGHYLNTNRSIETRFCIPTCANGASSDGCGGKCNLNN